MSRQYRAITESHVTEFNGFPLPNGGGPYYTNHLDKIDKTIQCALEKHPRTMAFRLDLHIPSYHWDDYCAPMITDSSIITRFFESLNAKLTADAMQRSRNNTRVHPCRLRYLWCKEKVSSLHPHYHLVLFVNKDRFHTVGSIDMQSGERGLFNMVVEAWASALGLLSPNPNIVHIPSKARYWLTQLDLVQKSPNICNFFQRAAYLAKVDSKHAEKGEHFFGSSRG